MQPIQIILYLLLSQYIVSQYRRGVRFGFYRRQDINSSESQIPKVWDEIQMHYGINTPLTKVGVYTKLAIGMEYQIFYIFSKLHSEEIILFQSQAFLTERDLSYKRNIVIESIVQKPSAGIMSIHHYKYLKINKILNIEALKTDSQLLYIKSIEVFNCAFDSERVSYYYTKAKFKDDLTSQSHIRLIILEEESHTLRVVNEIMKQW